MRLAVNEWIIHIKMFIFAGVVHGLETTCEKTFIFISFIFSICVKNSNEIAGKRF